MPNTLEIHSWPTGLPYAGLRSIKPANRRLENLLSYMSYLFIMITVDTRSSKATAEVMGHIKNLKLPMKNHNIDGKYHILVFDFLFRFVNDAKMLNMLDVQAFIALPTFRTETAETQIKTNLCGALRHSGITCPSEAIQYLLRTFTTSSSVHKILKDLVYSPQCDTQVEW